MDDGAIVDPEATLIGFLLIVSLGFSAAMAALSRWWDPESRSWATFSGASELSMAV
jgi:hypothetical protein